MHHGVICAGQTSWDATEEACWKQDAMLELHNNNALWAFALRASEELRMLDHQHLNDDALYRCQGHSHPKLLVALGIGSKLSADKIQPTAHKPTGYGQYSGVVPWPLNNDGRCCVKLRSVQA